MSKKMNEEKNKDAINIASLTMSPETTKDFNFKNTSFLQDLCSLKKENILVLVHMLNARLLKP